MIYECHVIVDKIYMPFKNLICNVMSLKIEQHMSTSVIS